MLGVHAHADMYAGFGEGSRGRGHPGTRVTPRPRPIDTARMKRVRRVKPSMEMTCVHETSSTVSMLGCQ